jgi:hypothetical protein
MGNTRARSLNYDSRGSGGGALESVQSPMGVIACYLLMMDVAGVAFLFLSTAIHSAFLVGAGGVVLVLGSTIGFVCGVIGGLQHRYRTGLAKTAMVLHGMVLIPLMLIVLVLVLGHGRLPVS